MPRKILFIVLLSKKTISKEELDQIQSVLQRVFDKRDQANQSIIQTEKPIVTMKPKDSKTDEVNPEDGLKDDVPPNFDDAKRWALAQKKSTR